MDLEGVFHFILAFLWDKSPLFSSYSQRDPSLKKGTNYQLDGGLEARTDF